MKPGTVTKKTLEKGTHVIPVSISFTNSDIKRLKALQKFYGTKSRSETVRKLISLFGDK